MLNLNMTGMSSNVKQNLKSAQLVLESLKKEHEEALRSLGSINAASGNGATVRPNISAEAEKSFNKEKIPLIKSALSQIQSGLDDSEALFTFVKYVECLEAENMKLSLHNQRLCEETSWLREELKYTQAKLSESESLLAQTVAEKGHLEFMLELRKYDNADEKCNDKWISPVDLGSPIQPVMAASVLGITSTPKKGDTPSQLDFLTGRGEFERQFVHTPPFMGVSQQLDGSAFMTSSLLEGDMSTISCTRSYHPSLMIGSCEPSFRPPTIPAVPPRFRTLHQIVAQYTSQGKHEVAASLCLQAIADMERSGGRDQPEVAVLLNILALVYRDQGKYSEAADLLQNVVGIREKAFGPNHPLVAAALNNLAVLYAKASRFSDAEPLCRRALAIREKLLGSSHPDVAKQLNNLALLCQSQGRFDEVELCFRKALDIYSKYYKSSSPVVLRAKNNLASTLLKLGNLADAESLLKAVLTPDRSLHPLQPPPPAHLSSTGTEADSAVFSSSSGSSYISPDAALPECNGATLNHCTSGRIIPLWLLVEQARKEGREQLSRLLKFDLSAWASEARIELPIVLSALRNLSIVYQRQGLQLQANLLRHWIQSSVGGATNGAVLAVTASNLPSSTSPNPNAFKGAARSCKVSASGAPSTPVHIPKPT
ncbi:unnamed protein product [Calicophoron daubneyi]|uniref:Kinesin light chain n=1 Tax=Calicophoron daubneyi TaxID=300641 RepID=A0AAV2TLU3_CALDB